MPDNFICSHKASTYCKRTFEPCSNTCKHQGQCGECVSYYIPAGQDPCESCDHLNLDKPNKHQEGE